MEISQTSHYKYEGLQVLSREIELKTMECRVADCEEEYACCAWTYDIPNQTAANHCMKKNCTEALDHIYKASRGLGCSLSERAQLMGMQDTEFDHRHLMFSPVSLVGPMSTAQTAPTPKSHKRKYLKSSYSTKCSGSKEMGKFQNLHSDLFSTCWFKESFTSPFVGFGYLLLRQHVCYRQGCGCLVSF